MYLCYRIIVCCKQRHTFCHLYFEKIFFKHILLVIEQETFTNISARFSFEIFVVLQRRRFFRECTHPKPHVLYSAPIEFSQLVVTLDCTSGRKLSLFSFFLTSIAVVCKSRKWPFSALDVLPWLQSCTLDMYHCWQKNRLSMHRQLINTEISGWM